MELERIGVADCKCTVTFDGKSCLPAFSIAVGPECSGSVGILSPIRYSVQSAIFRHNSARGMFYTPCALAACAYAFDYNDHSNGIILLIPIQRSFASGEVTLFRWSDAARHSRFYVVHAMVKCGCTEIPLSEPKPSSPVRPIRHLNNRHFCRGVAVRAVGLPVARGSRSVRRLTRIEPTRPWVRSGVLLGGDDLVLFQQWEVLKDLLHGHSAIEQRRQSVNFD